MGSITTDEGTETMGEDKKPIITIDDKDYTEDDLTPEQIAMVNHVMSLDQKVRSAEFNLTQLQVGRQAFMDRLSASLADVVTDPDDSLSAAS